jgi:hypothetical protein
MTVQAIRGVGLCARMTRSGDWAFDYALDLAVGQDVRLDIFFFPTPPSSAHAPRGRQGELAELSEQQRIQMEKDVRLYYDQMLGDYVNVGFRLCEGDEDPELRRCLLVRKEYDVLVLAYEGFHCRFGTRSIEEFAESMPCPVVLVGPERPDQFFLNTPAGLWIERLGLDAADRYHVNDVKVQSPPPGATPAG